jgi:MOSC domain-containing protein YiiM
MNGRLETIYVKRFKGGPMDTVPEVQLEAGQGLAGNSDRGGKRQVTLLEAEVWEAVMRAMSASLPPSTRRANLVLRGVPLPRGKGEGVPGRILRVGEARIRVLGPTTPCEQMEAALPGLEAALRPEWGGGVFGEVLDGGTIRVGDGVDWE